MNKEHFSSAIWIKRRFGFSAFIKLYHKTKLGIEKKHAKQQYKNAWKYKWKNINGKKIQENGKLEKNCKKVSQFSSNFIPEFKLQVLAL